MKSGPPHVPVALPLVLSFVIGSSIIGCNTEKQVAEATKKMNDETKLMNQQAAANDVAMATALEGLKDAPWLELLKATANGIEEDVAKAKMQFFKDPEAAAKQPPSGWRTSIPHPVT